MMDNRLNQDIDIVVDAISAAAREVEGVVSNHNKQQCKHSSFRYGHSDPSQECANCIESMCMIKTCLGCGKEV